MNGRPLSTQKKVRILVALTILAWATHTLLHQWGYGAEIAPGGTAAAADSAEKFVPGQYAAPGTLELRGEASIYGGEVRLRQVCRWTESDAAMFLPVADLVIVRIDENTSFKAVTLDTLRKTLNDAGVNLGSVRFAGPTLCTVRRTDAQRNDADMTMEQWIAARHGEPAPAPAADTAPGRREIEMPVRLSVTSDAIVAAAVMPSTRPATAVVVEEQQVRTLRSLLISDLAIRVALPVEQLQVSFNPSNDNVLNLSQPQFGFNIEARRVRDLGQVEWEVTIVAGNTSRKMPIIANARAWQNQVIVNKPLSYHQLIRSDDVSERRMLIDHVGDEPVLALDECVGQQAARDLKPQTVLTARMVDAIPLAKPGQLITISANQGGIRIKTVARALEGGSLGQTIRVRNDATNDNYNIVLSGPQEGTIGGSTDASKSAPRN